MFVTDIPLDLMIVKMYVNASAVFLGQYQTNLKKMTGIVLLH